MLGICYGFQAMAQALGGTVARTGRSEFGRTPLTVIGSGGVLAFAPGPVWMSHGDAVSAAPPGFAVTASTPDSPVAAFEDPARGLYGVQFHPEVLHTAGGQAVLERFLYEGAGCRPLWTEANIVEEQVAADPGPGRRQAGDLRAVRRRRLRGRGGTGAAGGRRPADLRVRRPRAAAAGRGEQVEEDFVAATGVRLHVVDAADTFLAALAGVSDPEAEAQDRRARVHPGVRGGGARDRRVRGGGVPRAGHAVPGRGRVRRRVRGGHDQVPPQRRRTARTTWRSRWSSRCARCSRTRYAGSGCSSGCRRRSSGGSRSRAPGWRSGSSAR